MNEQNSDPDLQEDKSTGEKPPDAEEDTTTVDAVSRDGDEDQAIRDIIKGAGVVYGGLLFEIVIAFLAQVLAARYLSVSDFGGVATGVALLNIGAIVGSLGLGRGMTRYFPRVDRTDRARIARGAYLLSVPFSILVGALVIFNAEFIASSIFKDSSVLPSVKIFGAVIPFAAALQLSVGAIRGQKIARYRVYIENIIRPILRFSLVITAVLYGAGQAGFAGAYALPYAVGSILAIVLVVRTLPEVIADWTIDITMTNSVFRYSFPFILSGAAGFIYRSADIFLIIYYLDSGAVGTYSVAYAAARLLMLFSSAFNFIGAPVSSEIEAGEGISQAVRINRSVLRWLTILSVPAMVPLVFFPAEFISAIYRPEYAAGARALIILAVAFAVHNVLSAQGSILEALGRSRLIAFNAVFSATANVALNIVLIPRYGITGAAIATAISYILMDCCLVLEVWHLTDTNLLTGKTFKPVIIAFPLLGLTWLVVPRIPSSLPHLILVGTVFATVYVLSIATFLGIETEELMLLRSVDEKYSMNLKSVISLAERFSK